MIESVLIFVGGIVYGIAGLMIAKRVRPVVDAALLERGVQGAHWGTYADTMVVLLWPLLACMIGIAGAYVTLKGTEETA